MLVLIPSHDDAAALSQSLPAMAPALRAGRDRLVVVADRCGDDTAAVARRLGAEALERRDETGGAGKGGALRFALSSLERSAGDAVAVFDADSIPSRDFFSVADERLAAGERALQAFVDPVPGRSLGSRLAAYSEIVSQRISDRLREALGWGVPLRGTGMVVQRDLLESALARCRTQVEDLELTLILEAGGVRVRRIAARVADPKPPGAAGITAQRARWLAGSLAAISARRAEIATLATSLSGLTLVLGLFCRPRSLFTLARLIALALLSLPPAMTATRVAAAVIGLFLARDAALLLGGLFVVDRPAFYLPAVIASPVYPLLWLVAAVRSRRAGGRWLSARRPS